LAGFLLGYSGYSMIRKSGDRFSLATNAKRLRGDHAQTINYQSAMSALIEASPKDARHHTIKAIAPERLPEHRDATRSPLIAMPSPASGIAVGQSATI
jgi:hypothetical protein